MTDLYKEYINGMTVTEEEFYDFFDNEYPEFKDLLERLFLEGTSIFEITGQDSKEEEVSANIEYALIYYYDLLASWVDVDNKTFVVFEEPEDWAIEDITKRGWKIRKENYETI